MMWAILELLCDLINVSCSIAVLWSIYDDKIAIKYINKSD